MELNEGRKERGREEKGERGEGREGRERIERRKRGEEREKRARGGGREGRGAVPQLVLMNISGGELCPVCLNRFTPDKMLTVPPEPSASLLHPHPACSHAHTHTHTHSCIRELQWTGNLAVQSSPITVGSSDSARLCLTQCLGRLVL